MLLPQTSTSSAENAKRLAEFVQAARWADQGACGQSRERFEQQLDGQTIWWSHAGVVGLIHLDPQCLCVAIGDRPAAAAGAPSLVVQRLGDWAEQTGIPIPPDARDTHSAEGFLRFAANCYFGIEWALHEHFSLTLASLSRPLWICGHALGGVAAQLLQCTSIFAPARAYMYGCPKVFARTTRYPARLRVTIRHVDDQATYCPVGYEHAPAEVLYVDGYGELSREVRWRHRPLALGYALRARTQAPRLDAGHGMGLYSKHLRAASRR